MVEASASHSGHGLKLIGSLSMRSTLNDSIGHREHLELKCQSSLLKSERNSIALADALVVVEQGKKVSRHNYDYFVRSRTTGCDYLSARDHSTKLLFEIKRTLGII
jgi:hypothetical protein